MPFSEVAISVRENAGEGLCEPGERAHGFQRGPRRGFPPDVQRPGGRSLRFLRKTFNLRQSLGMRNRKFASSPSPVR